MRIISERGAAPFAREQESSTVAVQDSVRLRRCNLGDAIASIDHVGSASFFCSDASRGRFQAMTTLYGCKPMRTEDSPSESVALPMDQGRV